MRLRTAVAVGVLSMGWAAVACGGGDDDSTGSSGGSAGHAAGRGGSAGTSGTKSAGGSSGSTSSGGSGGTTSSGGAKSSGGSGATGGSSTSGGRGGGAGRGGSTAVGGTNAQGGATESSGGEGGGAGAGDTSCLSAPLAGAGGENAGGEGGGSSSASGSAKAPLVGLVDMQIISWHNSDDGVPSFLIDDLTAFPGEFGGVVINAAWNMLQPTECGPIDTSTIDDALAQVRAYNADNPTAPVGVKLRVYGGSTAPDWAKAIDGGPVAILRNDAGCNTVDCTIHIGKFWTPEYINAWRAFQKQLAERYDDEPLIRHVAVTSCASQTDEPFVPTMAGELSGTDYTDQAGKDCLSGALDDYSAWKHTLIDFTFNPFNNLAGGRADSAFTISVMDACRAKLGSRCVIANHALSWPQDLTAPAQDVYDELQRLGAPLTFQTESPNTMDCQWTGTIALGVSLGAGAIEVWPKASLNGFLSLTSDNVATLASEFTNPIPVPTGDPVGSCPDFN